MTPCIRGQVVKCVNVPQQTIVHFVSYGVLNAGDF